MSSGRSHRRGLAPSVRPPNFVRRDAAALTFGNCRCRGLAYVQPLVEDDDPTVAGSKSIRTWDEYTRNMLAMHQLRAEARGRWPNARASSTSERWTAAPLAARCRLWRRARFARPFASSTWIEAGLDINPEVTAFTQEIGLPTRTGDFTHLPVICQYDVIFFEPSARALPEPARVLGQGPRNATAPGGCCTLMC